MMADPMDNDCVDCQDALKHARDLMTALLKNIAVSKDRCRGRDCKAPLIWVVHANGRLTPYDADGTNHFSTCVDRDRFKKNQFRKGNYARTTNDH